MQFKLTLVASNEDGTAAITTVDVTLASTDMAGEKPTLGDALIVTLEKLKQAGFGVD